MDMLRVVTMNVLQRKVCNMKTVIGAILLMVGIVMMAGSGGDCDGKCMENANTIGEMLAVAGFGAILALAGGVILFKDTLDE